MWISNISSIVFTRVKVDGLKKLKTKYPNIYFTTSDKAQKNPEFPTVYIHELPGKENGNDLENSFINSAIFTFQIEVTDNVSQNRTREVMDEIMGIMKKMRFSVVGMPEFNNTDTYRGIARFRRTIDWNDNITNQ